jgi:acetylornithine/succinyldiaminopimelate/putrescine aminotransferase
MAGVQFAGGSGDVVKGLRQRDVLATKAGDDVLRLLPPLVVKPGEIKTALEALGAVLEGGAGVAGA